MRLWVLRKKSFMTSEWLWPNSVYHWTSSFVDDIKFIRLSLFFRGLVAFTQINLFMKLSAVVCILASRKKQLTYQYVCLLAFNLDTNIAHITQQKQPYFAIVLNLTPQLIYQSYLTKGHLISKGLFDVIVLTKKPTDLFLDFCPSL